MYYYIIYILLSFHTSSVLFLCLIEIRNRNSIFSVTTTIAFKSNIWLIWNKWKYSKTRPNWQVGEKSIRTHLISVIIGLINVSILSLLWQHSAIRRRKWLFHCCTEPEHKTKNKSDDNNNKKKSFFFDDYTLYRITL